METWFGRRQGVEGAVKNYKADRAFSIDRFEADLGKLLDGHDKLYYRFALDKALDQQILGYLSNQRQRRLKTAYPPHTIIDPTTIHRRHAAAQNGQRGRPYAKGRRPSPAKPTSWR